MKLYFQTGKNRRVAIDTERKIYNADFSYLGAYHTYIKVSAADFRAILQEIDFNCYDYDDNF